MDPTEIINKKPSTIPEPRDAVTVILARESDQPPFQILLMRRHKNQSFMGGAFVFPGGKLDERDCSLPLGAYARGLSPEEAKQKLNEPGLTNEKSLGLFFAAVREIFEEAGILIAAPKTGGEIDFNDAGIHERFSKHRSMLQNNKMTLNDLAQAENIEYSLDQFLPYSHWITPKVESKRFDTRFMLGRMPKRQHSVHDSIEMTETLWISPEEALLKSKSGEILLMPPTLKHVEEMSEYSSIDELFAFASSNEILPVLPQAFKTEMGVGIKLPHDPEFSLSEYKQPPRPHDKSRIMLINKEWKILSFEDYKKLGS